MADIKKELNGIKNAVYGREVRGSIHDGIKKINDEVENATDLSESAKHQVENIQQQVNQLVIEGDSSVEAAQARVTEDGKVFSTLRDRLNYTDTLLAQIAVNVKNFGAVGDGITNDIDAFRQAYEATPPGGTLFIPQADEFYLWNPSNGHNGSNACLLIDKPITIIAAKKALIKFADFAEGFLNGIIRRMIRIESDNVTIDGLQIDCNTDNLYKVDGQGYKWWFAEEGDTDILVHRTDIIDVVNPCQNIVIKNSYFYQGHTQIRFSGYDFFTDIFVLPDEQTTRDCIVENNYFERARGNAINLSGGSRRVNVRHNKFVNCYYHSFRNYYGVENCSFEGNHVYRDLNEMAQWYIDYPNRFYRTSNPYHPLYPITRGLVRVGRGNEYSKYIRNITIARNKLEQYMEQGPNVIHKDGTEFANILTDYNRGGVIIKDNTVIGGLTGIAFNRYIDSESTSTVIRNNDIRDVQVGIKVQYVTTSHNIPIFVKNNTNVNVETPLVLDDTRAFVNTNLGKKTITIAPHDSVNKNLADMVLDGENDTYIIERISTTMGTIEAIKILDGEVLFTEQVIIRRAIKIEGSENTIIKAMNGINNTAILSVRADSVELNNLALQKSSAVNLYGLEVRNANSVLISKLLIDGFSVNMTVRDAKEIIINKCKFSNSTANDLRIGVDGPSSNVIMTENVIDSSGSQVNLGANSTRCLFSNNVLNGKTVTNNGTNNVVSNNVA